MFRFSIALLLLLPLTALSQAWTLDSCISHAWHVNLGVRQSSNNIRLAEINETQAIGGFLPTLNGQASHGYNWGQRIDPFTNQFASERIRSNNLGLATSVNLFNGFQQVNTYKQANLNTESSKWNFEKTRNDIALNVASAYLSVLINKELMDITRRTMEATERQVSRMEKLVTAGQMAQGNLNDILAQLAQNNASYVNAKNNFDLAKLSLMQLLLLDGAEMETFNVIVPEIDEVEALEMISNPEVVVEAALNNFPEVKSARTGLASAEMGVKIASANYYPSLNASFSYGTGYSGAAKVVSGNPDTLSFPIGTVLGSGDYVLSLPQLMYGSDDYTTKAFDQQLKDNINKSFFLTLNIPLFNGFSARSGVKRAEITHLNAELQLEQTRQTIEQNVYRAFTNARASLASYQANKISADASQRAFEWAETRYEQGAINLLDFSDARTRYENALASLTRSKYEFLFNLKVLEFYQGKTISLK